MEMVDWKDYGKLKFYKKWKKIFAWIPVESLIKDYQTDFYKALKSSDKNTPSTLFIEFMLSLLL